MGSCSRSQKLFFSESTALALQNNCRYVATASTTFDHPKYQYRQRHTYNSLPLHDANRFGGRTAYLREIGPIDHKRQGRLFKRQHEIAQWNVEMWCAQQTLRKRWKGRDWVVVEMPFAACPPVLQRVLPEVYTDIPVGVEIEESQEKDHLRRKYKPPENRFYRHQTKNIRQKVFDLEELQTSLFGTSITATEKVNATPYPKIRQSGSSQLSFVLDAFL